MPVALRLLFVPVSFLLLISLSDCAEFLQDRNIDRSAESTPEAREPTATPAPSPTPIPPESITPGVMERTTTPILEPRPTPTPELTASDLEAFLLVERDFPTGWSAVSVGETPTEVPGAEDLDTLLVSAFFQRSDLGPYVGHLLLLTESVSDARTAFAALQDELGEPDILDEVTDQVRSWDSVQVDVDDLGDETAAFKAVGDTGLIPVDADMVVVRRGRFVMLLIHAELMSVNGERTWDLVNTAVDRLPED